VDRDEDEDDEDAEEEEDEDGDDEEEIGSGDDDLLDMNTTDMSEEPPDTPEEPVPSDDGDESADAGDEAGLGAAPDRIVPVVCEVESVLWVNDTAVIFIMKDASAVKEVRVMNGESTAIMTEMDGEGRAIRHDNIEGEIGSAALRVADASRRDELLASAQEALVAAGFEEASLEVEERRRLEAVDANFSAALAERNPEERRRRLRVLTSDPGRRLNSCRRRICRVRGRRRRCRMGIDRDCRARQRWNRRPFQWRMNWCWRRRHNFFDPGSRNRNFRWTNRFWLERNARRDRGYITSRGDLRRTNGANGVGGYTRAGTNVAYYGMFGTAYNRHRVKCGPLYRQWAADGWKINGVNYVTIGTRVGGIPRDGYPRVNVRRSGSPAGRLHGVGYMFKAFNYPVGRDGNLLNWYHQVGSRSRSNGRSRSYWYWSAWSARWSCASGARGNIARQGCNGCQGFPYGYTPLNFCGGWSIGRRVPWPKSVDNFVGALRGRNRAHFEASLRNDRPFAPNSPAARFHATRGFSTSVSATPRASLPPPPPSPPACRRSPVAVCAAAGMCFRE